VTRTVLLIDDDADLLLTLSAAFRARGYATLTAGDGRAAMKLLEPTPPHLVVTDILMPDQEGIATIMALRKRPRPPKIIAMSGGGRIGGSNLLEWALNLGADAALAKPFAPSALVRAAAALLRESEAPAALTA
jgi:DNA-binding response OmpR family regulator